MGLYENANVEPVRTTDVGSRHLFDLDFFLSTTFPWNARVLTSLDAYAHLKKTSTQTDDRVVALLFEHGFWMIAEIVWAMGTREKNNSPGKILLFAKSIRQNIRFVYTTAKDSAYLLLLAVSRRGKGIQRWLASFPYHPRGRVAGIPAREPVLLRFWHCQVYSRFHRLTWKSLCKLWISGVIFRLEIKTMSASLHLV